MRQMTKMRKAEKMKSLKKIKMKMNVELADHV